MCIRDRRDTMEQLNHIVTRYPERYDMAVKLAVATVCDFGFFQPDGPYNVVNSSMEAHVFGKELLFGFAEESARDWLHSLLWHMNCGTDEHLDRLNQPDDDQFDSKAKCILGTQLIRSLTVLPLDLDCLGKGSFAVSYTHLRAHETPEHLVCRLLLEKKKTDRSPRLGE
eukprot:TRINITY_DN10427_c0_g1_i1.p1 TRINITY_DN10427_c0_g1~~TRINITY_DN10427_c0_g1_i1.p1  ORF type:complete len:169 (+),score=37.96 TRINITY_DN10427_c0_g1_i1:175-681(+)